VTQPTQEQAAAAAAARGVPPPSGPRGSGAGNPGAGNSGSGNSGPGRPGPGPGRPGQGSFDAGGWPPPAGFRQPPRQPAGAYAPETDPRYADPGADTGWIMPSPEALEQYERIHPGMADRILALSENEARYRWGSDVESNSGSTTDRITQLFALVIVVVFFAAAIYLTGSGKQVAGVILGVVDLVALISIFATTGRRNRR
jgi:uncharacterized membrane protein